MLILDLKEHFRKSALVSVFKYVSSDLKLAGNSGYFDTTLTYVEKKIGLAFITILS
jgi:hypothetical protein